MQPKPKHQHKTEGTRKISHKNKQIKQNQSSDQGQSWSEYNPSLKAEK
jgi:hypothetical protein